jgi:hypothetical protein
MGMEDAKPSESTGGMILANNAILAELIGTLIESNAITRTQLMNAINAARRKVNAVQSEGQRDADFILAALQKRFPVA